MKLTCILILVLSAGAVRAQIPVEVFVGHEKATVDIMFFKFFEQKSGKKSHWLFFNRNRASIDYRMTNREYLPQFGFTEAVSFNHPALKGFAPVAVGQVLSWGVFPKAGVQFVHLRKNLTIFTWLVCETLKEPDLDYFLLLRYTPKIARRWRLFAQFESINVFPTAAAANNSFTQRLRLGLSVQKWQFGAGADFNETGNANFVITHNIGGFLRHEF